MAEELNKTEARQGDRRRTNQTALYLGVIFAVVALGALWIFFSMTSSG